jgi:hypothetical protein
LTSAAVQRGVWRISCDCASCKEFTVGSGQAATEREAAELGWLLGSAQRCPLCHPACVHGAAEQVAPTARHGQSPLVQIMGGGEYAGMGGEPVIMLGVAPAPPTPEEIAEHERLQREAEERRRRQEERAKRGLIIAIVLDEVEPQPEPPDPTQPIAMVAQFMGLPIGAGQPGPDVIEAEGEEVVEGQGVPQLPPHVPEQDPAELEAAREHAEALDAWFQEEETDGPY